MEILIKSVRQEEEGGREGEKAQNCPHSPVIGLSLWRHPKRTYRLVDKRPARVADCKVYAKNSCL